MVFKIELRSKAAKELEKLSPKLRNDIIKTIDDLTENPFPDGFKKLSGISKKICSKLEVDCIYRIRVGDYRILYAVNGSTVTICILRIGARKDIYQFIKKKQI